MYINKHIYIFIYEISKYSTYYAIFLHVYRLFIYIYVIIYIYIYIQIHKVYILEDLLNWIDAQLNVMQLCWNSYIRNSYKYKEKLSKCIDIVGEGVRG